MPQLRNSACRLHNAEIPRFQSRNSAKLRPGVQVTLCRCSNVSRRLHASAMLQPRPFNTVAETHFCSCTAASTALSLAPQTDKGLGWRTGSRRALCVCTFPTTLSTDKMSGAGAPFDNCGSGASTLKQQHQLRVQRQPQRLSRDFRSAKEKFSEICTRIIEHHTSAAAQHRRKTKEQSQQNVDYRAGAIRVEKTQGKSAPS